MKGTGFITSAGRPFGVTPHDSPHVTVHCTLGAYSQADILELADWLRARAPAATPAHGTSVCPEFTQAERSRLAAFVAELRAPAPDVAQLQAEVARLRDDLETMTNRRKGWERTAAENSAMWARECSEHAALKAALRKAVM